MKPKINLRLEVAGEESLLPLFENCLISYLKFFEIGKLLIYTTSNLQQQVENFIVGLDLPAINDAEIRDIDKFYEEYYDKFPKSVKELLDYSREKYWYGRNLFYMKIRYVMDYYLIKDGFVLSDIDIEIFDHIKPILDWMNSDYILYHADYLDNYYDHNPKIVESVGGPDFFKPLPQFNCGWMCLPKSIKINIEEFFKIMKEDPDSGPAEMSAMAILLIKNKIKTKILPRELMVTVDTKKSEMENKTLAHFGPYGLKELEAKAKREIKISCIIPIYNQKPEYFKQAVESVINQTRKPEQIIIIDDGSDKKFVDEYEKMILKIENVPLGIKMDIYHNKKNMGVGFSRQRGADESTGEYICFLSSDDIWDDKFLETMIKTTKQHPRKILYSKYYMINENIEIVGDANVQGFDNHEDFCIACWECAKKENMFVNFSTTFFPKKVFKKVRFDKDLRFGEDLDFLLRSMKHFKYHLVPEYILKYRAEDNMTSKILDKIPKQNIKIRKKCMEYWQNG